MKLSRNDSEGSILVAAAILAVIFALILSAFYQSLLIKSTTTYQASSWQEALHGADAGADYAVQLLTSMATSTGNPDSYGWTANGWTFTNSSYQTNGERTLNSDQLPAFSTSSDTTSQRSDVKVTKVALDVYTRNSDGTSNTPWFRIRSTAQATLPGKRASADKRDAELRHMKLSATVPYVSRTVEVIVKPKYRFPRAITTNGSMSLGNSNNWNLDSYNSSKAGVNSDAQTWTYHKDPGGTYPSSSSRRLANGSVATLQTEPVGTTYGPLIAGNGADVDGDVSTVGGDDPSTTEHENVSGNDGMDQSRIHDDFDDTLKAMTKPTWTFVSSNPNNNTGFVPGTQSAPARYIINGDLGSFTVQHAPDGTYGYIEIIVNGNLDTGHGNSAYIEIPQNVYATIYVDGNIDFGNSDINMTSASSKNPTHLTIFGVHPTGTYSQAGNGNAALAFFGPNYDVTLSGNIEYYGSMVGNSFNINGGGNGGFHYDEALGNGGEVSGWKVVSYFDDARTDL